MRNEKGQLVDTEYTIHEQPPGCENPVDKSVENCKPECEKPILENQILDNPTLEKPILENRTQSNTHKSNKEKINTDGVNIYPSIINKSVQTEKADVMDTMEKYRQLIYKNIEYDILMERYDNACIDEYVEIMLDAICSQGETVRISGAEYPVGVVKGRLLKLDSSHIEYVIGRMSKNTTKIRNIRSYMLTALYNSYTTMDNFYRAEVNHDLSG